MTEDILGKKVRDRVTGFEGVATAFAVWLYGCNTICVAPSAVNNEVKDAKWFDEGRLEILEWVVNKHQVQSSKPGGDYDLLPKVKYTLHIDTLEKEFEAL